MRNFMPSELPISYELLIMQESKSTLIIFTVTYPYDAGANKLLLAESCRILSNILTRLS